MTTIENEETKPQDAQQVTLLPRKPKPPVRLKKELEVELSDKDRLERMSDLLRAMKRKDELTTQKALQTSEINADIKAAQRDVRLFQKALDYGKEKREVECVENHVYSTNTVEIVRTDTGAIVERRAMTGPERQADLPLGATTPKNGEPLTASIGEHLAKSQDEAAANDGDSAICGVEIDGRRCMRTPHETGAHDLADIPTITDPQDLLDGAAPEGNGEGGEAAPKRRGRPPGAKNKP